MKPIMKNQTVKRLWTIRITDDEGNEIDCQSIWAESAREAVAKAYPFVVDPRKNKQ
ncbi:MAG: hypothetical protein IJG15_04945 [Lachnospiraceae bacterium]|nr:hypothetical protein [Lachnospiraceae bacterium]